MATTGICAGCMFPHDLNDREGYNHVATVLGVRRNWSRVPSTVIS